MEQPDIRWKQRFQNYEKALLRLQEAVEEEELSELERNGLIQRFEFTIELAWKTLKDFLENEGFVVKSPKETIREAYRNQLIADAQVFLDALQRRNELSHDYDEDTFEKAEVEIKEKFFPALNELYLFFIRQMNRNQSSLFDE